MNTTCDLNVDWTTCANCARLKARVDNADAAARTASERVDQTYDEYRAERDAGRAVIYTSQWLAWRDRIGNLEQALDEAHATWTAAIDEWAASINEHHRLHEERRQETEEDDVLRDAVRAIEHGGTIQIRGEWDFGYRHGRRAALRELRELRELLDDMIASIDDDTEEGV